VSTLGALFLSEIMNIVPCILCWYQRIFMLPLVFILPAGLFPLDTRLVRYALPLTLFGWMIALFHVLVVAGIVPESIRPCTQGIPCKDQQIKRDMYTPEIERVIAQDLADAKALNVTMTPEFFVNGRPLPDFGYDQLKKLVNDAVAKAY